MRIVCCVYLNRFILRLDSSVRVVRRLFVCVDKNQYKFIQQSAIKNIRTRYDCKLIISSTKVIYFRNFYCLIISYIFNSNNNYRLCFFLSVRRILLYKICIKLQVYYLNSIVIFSIIVNIY